MPGIFNFEKPGAISKKVFEITSFAGIDLSSAPTDISEKRSPDALNMMPDSKGNPIKRTGFSVTGNYGGRINGCFFLGKHRVIHAGKNLFVDGKLFWSGMADEISSAQVIGEKLYIFDGQEALCFDGAQVVPLCDLAYIPTVLISKNADFYEKETAFSGDGESTEFILDAMPYEVKSVSVNDTATECICVDEKIIFGTAPGKDAKIVISAVFEQEPGGNIKEEFNLISRRWKESFICETGTERVFTLSKTDLSKGRVKAFIRDKNGDWQEKTEGIDFSVDREKGKIVFEKPIDKTPVAGEDNLIIEAEKYFDGYENRINRCRKSIAFDTGGTANRIFVCGNPDEPNRDHWCMTGDPTYWPDTYYSELGTANTKIIGYSIVDGYLGAHIAPAFDGRSVVLREAALDENGNAVFPIAKHLQGEEASAPNSFVYMENEPLFLTKRGVYAITAADISGEKYTQNRSYFINKVLCDEDIENAFCAKWKQFYVISAGRKLYLLDTGQKSFERAEPQSAFQYECYLWDGFDARILWEENGALFFGDNGGKVCRFEEDIYSDNGKAINAYWTIPDFCGDAFWRNKTIRTVAVQTAAYPLNKLRIECRRNGIWEVLKEWTDRLSFFAWNAVSWAEFTWSGNKTAKTLAFKTKIKKFDKVGFRVVCDENNKAFGLCGFAAEFTEGGRYKK
ncbi:MAG: hypothetical protein IJO01_04625 [Oscillospiraceae bacterium]|nr:hypothetical protein [Oscillospiraceae bacterium]